ncbi:hypothetical protein ACFY8P_26915 [Streptomyces sp. NPDC012693]|uniref:DUF6197 family protein n=1 Tax=Streptomyces sp. NPDC012693 TaxID=3364844 RepID=UPI0036B6A4A5
MTSTITATVFTDEVLARAAELARDSYRPVWTGASGEESTGASVARHLEAAAALLETDGWTRTYHHGPAPSTELPAIESMSTQEMVREVLIAVREESAVAPRTLSTALDHAARGGDGDADTRDVAYEVLSLVVRALTGHGQAAPRRGRSACTAPPRTSPPCWPPAPGSPAPTGPALPPGWPGLPDPLWRLPDPPAPSAAPRRPGRAVTGSRTARTDSRGRPSWPRR